MNVIEFNKFLQDNYIRCNINNPPSIGDCVYYPISESVIYDDPYIIEGILIDIVNDDFIVNINRIGIFRDKLEKFYTKKNN